MRNTQRFFKTILSSTGLLLAYLNVNAAYAYYPEQANYPSPYYNYSYQPQYYPVPYQYQPYQAYQPNYYPQTPEEYHHQEYDTSIDTEKETEIEQTNINNIHENTTSKKETTTSKKETTSENIVLEHDSKAIKKINKANNGKVNKGKLEFINKILPIIIAENIKIKNDRLQLKDLTDNVENFSDLNKADQLWLKKLAKEYKLSITKNNYKIRRKQLLNRVNTINPAVAMSQAAIESGWGKSRFTKEANNIFGIWTYNDAEGLKPKNRDPDKKHFVRVFNDLNESVSIYMNNLNTHPAYKKLRDIRAELEETQQAACDAGMIEQANGLEKYSAIGDKYIELVNKVIKQNDLISLSQATIQELNAEEMVRNF
ncbi:MAG: glucosaminidase domain-containing protein [Gammaproteobacteria bacterium]|nr:glucosaminidase domain-containing protein [Gammaproteobacteria bacterium]